MTTKVRTAADGSGDGDQALSGVAMAAACFNNVNYIHRTTGFGEHCLTHKSTNGTCGRVVVVCMHAAAVHVHGVGTVGATLWH